MQEKVQSVNQENSPKGHSQRKHGHMLQETLTAMLSLPAWARSSVKSLLSLSWQLFKVSARGNLPGSVADFIYLSWNRVLFLTQAGLELAM